MYRYILRKNIATNCVDRNKQVLNVNNNNQQMGDYVSCINSLLASGSKNICKTVLMSYQF